MKYLSLILLFFLFGCFHNPTLPITGQTLADSRLQYDVYKTLLQNLKSYKCQTITDIFIKNISINRKESQELWKINACGHKYHTTITYINNLIEKKTFYRVLKLKEEKTKKYHAKVYTRKEYIKKLPHLNEPNILFEKKSLKYLISKSLPKESPKENIYREKTLFLDKKYNSFKSIIIDKTFFTKYPINHFTSYELETVIYFKNRALVTFSGTSNYSFFREFYLFILNQNRIIPFNLGNESGCGSPIEVPLIPTKGNFYLPPYRVYYKKNKLTPTVTLDNIPLPNF